MTDMGKFKINESQLRVCEILLALAGHEMDGLSQAQIADTIESTCGRVHHDLRNLGSIKMVEKIPTNRWRLGPLFVQIALDYQASMSRIFLRAEETKSRFDTRTGAN